MTIARPAEMRGVTASISELVGCSGLELVAKLADGSIRRPPMAKTLPFTLLEPEEGRVRLTATPEARFFNLTNTMHGSWIVTMLDTVMSLAAQTTLAPGDVFDTPLQRDDGPAARHNMADDLHLAGLDGYRPDEFGGGFVRRTRRRQAPCPWHVDMPHRAREAVMSARRVRA